MVEETATAPVEGEITSDTEVETNDAPAQEADGFDDEPDEELDEAGNPKGPADEDLEEIEHNGKKYKVPKAVQAERLMQADYTRKTQELAQQRQALEAQQAQHAQASQEEVQARAELLNVDQRLAQYQAVDWQTWSNEDPIGAQAAFMDFQQLKDARQNTAGKLQQAFDQRNLAAQRANATARQQFAAELPKVIPGWNDDLGAKVSKFAIEQGLTAQDLQQVTDPRVVKILHLAYVGTQATKQQKAVQQVARAQATSPVPTVRGGGGKPSVRADTNDFAAFEKIADKKIKRG